MTAALHLSVLGLDHGAASTIPEIPRSFWNKYLAVSLIVRANMDRVVGYGKGNKVAKREAFLSAPPEWYDDKRLSISEVDALAEFYGESRTFRRTRLNFHD